MAFIPEFGYPSRREDGSECGHVRRSFLSVTQEVTEPGTTARLKVSLYLFASGDWGEELEGEHRLSVLRKLNLPETVELPEPVVLVPESAKKFVRPTVSGYGVYDVTVGSATEFMTLSEARKALSELVADFKKVGVE